MKTKILLIVALLVLAIGATVVSVQAATQTFQEAANGYIQPMGTCTKVCSWCVIYGHNGACTASGSCC